MAVHTEDKRWLTIRIDAIECHNVPSYNVRYRIFDRGPSPYIKMSSPYKGNPQITSVKENDSKPTWYHPFNYRLRFDTSNEPELVFEVFDKKKPTKQQRIDTGRVKLDTQLVNDDGIYPKVTCTFDQEQEMRLEIVLTAKYWNDPYKEYDINNRPCWIISVDKIEGLNLTKDGQEAPFHIKLSCPTSSVSDIQKSQQILVKPNQQDPVWENPFENVKFLFDPDKENKLDFHICDSIQHTIDLKELTAQNPKTLLFDENTRMGLCVYFTRQESSATDLKLGPELCPQEKRYALKRKQHVCKALSKYNIHVAEDKVPIIAVLGSGGGFRALIGYHGVMSGLQTSGILDMVTYCVGLSGSAWYLSTLFSNLGRQDPVTKQQISIEDSGELMKKAVCTYSLSKSLPIAITNMLTKYTYERLQGHDISLTDVYGRFIGNILLGERYNYTLTDQKEAIENGKYPMPIYSAIHVKNDESAKQFHEWVEFSPFEIGIPKYKISLKPEDFHSRLFMGHVVRKADQEPRLHYLQGLWGSAFSVQLWRLIHWDEKLVTPAMLRQAEEDKIAYAKEVLEGKKVHSPESDPTESWYSKLGNYVLKSLKNHIPLLNTICHRSGKSSNFMKELDIRESDDDKINFQAATMHVPIGYKHIFDKFSTKESELYMVDGGLAINSPYPPVLHKARKADLILSFDFSARTSDSFESCFQELILAESWANVCHVRFPNIATKLPKIFEDGETKECYIFENVGDTDCPIVMHFPLINTKYTVKDLIGDKGRAPKEKFQIFDDPKGTYSTFNFNYTTDAYDLLEKLMEQNVKNMKDEIIERIRTVANHKGNKPMPSHT